MAVTRLGHGGAPVVADGVDYDGGLISRSPFQLLSVTADKLLFSTEPE
jgi:hypothetical protein